MEKKELKPRLKKGLWKTEEDLILKKYVETHGEGNWTTVSEKSGLKRTGKSCRLRWKNYLRPNIKRGCISEDEKELIIRLHKLLGNRWSLIAGRLPGRTDNEVKNYWNTHLNKRCSQPKTTNNHPNNNSEKLLHQLPCSQPVRDENSEKLSKGSDRREEDDERSYVSTPWIEAMKNFNYDIQTPPLPTIDAQFYDDDEPFLPILDSIVLFEAFGNH